MSNFKTPTWWKWSKWQWEQYSKYNRPPVINLTQHLYVCGLTGTGKTNTVMSILQDFSNIPYLVIEPTESRQYRNLNLSGENGRITHVYSIGDNRGEKIELNPFYIPHGADFASHIEHLVVCFSSMLSREEPLVHNYLERAIHEIYYDRGWDPISDKHCSLEKEEDYDSDEHYFYFPRMRDLYNKVVELSKASAFAEGGENKGTIKELLKSHVGAFLNGTLGRTFNTYRNDLYAVFYDNIVFEIPNTESKSVKGILNMILGSIINISGRHEAETLQHITVFEEATLLFRADSDNDNASSAVATKIGQLLTTSRKFGEGIIIVNQDPAVIHKDVLGNIKQRLIHQISLSDVCENLAKNYGIKPKDITDADKYTVWYREEGQYEALNYTISKVSTTDYKEPDSVKQPHRKFILGYAGLDNINDQLYYTSYYIKMLADDPQNRGAIAKDFHQHIRQLIISEKCKCEQELLPEYMAHLTCILLGMYGEVKAGIYRQLKTIYEDLIQNSANISDNSDNLFLHLVQEGKVQDFTEKKDPPAQLIADKNYVTNFYSKYGKH